MKAYRTVAECAVQIAALRPTRLRRSSNRPPISGDTDTRRRPLSASCRARAHHASSSSRQNEYQLPRLKVSTIGPSATRSASLRILPRLSGSAKSEKQSPGFGALAPTFSRRRFAIRSSYAAVLYQHSSGTIRTLIEDGWPKIAASLYRASSRRLRFAATPSRGTPSIGKAAARHDSRSRCRDFCRLLPPCFPGGRDRGGEAQIPQGGAPRAVAFIEKNWSGRRDSNPRPRPWQSVTRLEGSSDPPSDRGMRWCTSASSRRHSHPHSRHRYPSRSKTRSR